MQISRLFEIVYMLLHKKHVTAKELSKHFEVSQRTIYRDIEHLCQAGIPLYTSKGRGGGIGILPEFVLNKTLFTDDEKIEVLSALQSLNAVNSSEANGVLAKFSALFGQADNQNWIEIDFSGWGKGSGNKDTWYIIKEAIIKRQLIGFNYSSVKGESTTRVVEPLKLVFKGQAWYLYAYCRQKQDMRFFKISRLKGVTVYQERFTRVAPERIFAEHDTSSFTRTNIRLVLAIDKAMAFRVYDEFEDYSVTDTGDFLVNCCVPHEEWLYGYLLTFGSRLQILQPQEVRQEFQRRLRKTLELYEQSIEGDEKGEARL